MVPCSNRQTCGKHTFFPYVQLHGRIALVTSKEQTKYFIDSDSKFRPHTESRATSTKKGGWGGRSPCFTPSPEKPLPQKFKNRAESSEMAWNTLILWSFETPLIFETKPGTTLSSDLGTADVRNCFYSGTSFKAAVPRIWETKYPLRACIHPHSVLSPKSFVSCCSSLPYCPSSKVFSSIYCDAFQFLAILCCLLFF